MKYGKKAKKLIKAGGAVPWERPYKRKKKLICRRISTLVKILRKPGGATVFVESGWLARAKEHIKRCPFCKDKGSFILKL